MTSKEVVKTLQGHKKYECIIANNKINIQIYIDNEDEQGIERALFRIAKAEDIIEAIKESFQVLNDEEFVILNTLISNPSKTFKELLYEITAITKLSCSQIERRKSKALHKIRPIIEPAYLKFINDEKY